MGRKARSLRHEAKMREKRATKAARKAQYQSLAGTGKKKSKKAVYKFSPTKHRHVGWYCGNTGCSRCFPQYNRSWGLLARLQGA